MGMNLEREDYSTTVPYFVADTTDVEKAIKTAGANLDAYTPVTESDGTVTQITASTDDIYGITAASASADEDVPVFIHGAFFAEDLVLPDGIEADDIEVTLRNKGIYLK